MVRHSVTFIFLFVSFFLMFENVRAKGDERSRPTRGFEQMRLAVSRNFGKRAIRLKSPPDIDDWVVRQERNFEERNVQGAYGFGKRSVNAMQTINDFMIDLYNLEAKIKRLRLAQQENNDLPLMQDS